MQKSEFIAKAKVNASEFAKGTNCEIVYSAYNEDIVLTTLNVNRPGLLLAGYDTYFEHTRVQVLGNAEIYYLEQLSSEDRKIAVNRLISKGIPCVVVARGLNVPTEMIDAAKEYRVPIFSSTEITPFVVNNIAAYLKRALAPKTQIHGVLMDIDGIGVLINGKSGIGKSEAALELVHRGHRLVADDAVIIKKIDNKLYGSCPENIRYFMEIRGIGIINVKSMYGVSGVLPEKKIMLSIELERWQEGKEYERLGLDEQYTEILGVKVPKLTIPVIPGRNLAIVMEVAAKNARLKHLGYNAAEELNRNIIERNKELDKI